MGLDGGAVGAFGAPVGAGALGAAADGGLGAAGGLAAGGAGGAPSGFAFNVIRTVSFFRGTVVVLSDLGGTGGAGGLGGLGVSSLIPWAVGSNTGNSGQIYRFAAFIVNGFSTFLRGYGCHRRVS